VLKYTRIIRISVDGGHSPRQKRVSANRSGLGPVYDLRRRVVSHCDYAGRSTERQQLTSGSSHGVYLVDVSEIQVADDVKCIRAFWQRTCPKFITHEERSVSDEKMQKSHTINSVILISQAP